MAEMDGQLVAMCEGVALIVIGGGESELLVVTDGRSTLRTLKNGSKPTTRTLLTAGPLIGVRVEASSRFNLLWWARHVGVGAKHAAVSRLRVKPEAAAGADIEELAGVGRHRFDCSVATAGTSNRGFEDHSLSSSGPQDNPA